MAAKKNVRQYAREVMQKFNYDPLESLVMLAQDAGTNAGVKQEIATTLLPFIYPKLASVTLDGEVNTSITATSQAALLRKVLEDPALADAAQRISLAAAEASLEQETNEALGMGGFVQ
jgi:hypothetical protein